MEAEIQSDGITLFEQLKVFGELREHREKIEDEEYEIEISSSGFVPLSELVRIERDEKGELKLVQLCFDKVDGISASVRKVTEEGNGKTQPQETFDTERVLPGPPEIQDISNQTRRRFYRRLVNNPSSQPAIMREIIFREEKISKKKLKEQMSAEGYEPESGGFSASLIVLSDVTEEVERAGRGDDEIITWIGN
ncbi:hypothetical protein BRD15_10920 [Halobacteriales archaeon SW_6_65_15]|nr:MAG: hypothetical protein BRD15_10920 [Halobacteriales archaeon SW_6_65_15]